MSQIPTGSGPTQASQALQVTSLIDTATRAFTAGELAQPEQIAMQLTANLPNDPRGWWLLGRVRTAQGRFKDAESALARAWFLLPSDAEIAAARGHLRLREGRNAEAAEFFREAMTSRPDHPDARLMYAESLRRDGKAQEALGAIGGSMTAVAAHVRGKCLHDVGDLAAAEAELRRGLSETTAPMLRSQLNLRLGLVLDELGRPDEAFQAIKVSRTAIPARFDDALFLNRLRSIREFFTKETIAQLARPTRLTRRPVFIAAMARSGTSLLERMIASHPKAAAAGEIGTLMGLIRSWQNPNDPAASYPQILRTFDATRLDGVVNAYLTATDEVAGQAEHVTDKHLSNWMHVGFIAMAFPAATIIHIERDPMDTGLSCFERLMNHQMPWSADLATIGKMLAMSEWMMEFWHSVLPGRITRLRYEKLVTEPRGQLERVLDAIGLPWDDACLAHERVPPGRAPLPPGAGTEQASRRVYDASVGRSARYVNELAPMKAAYEAMKASLGGA